MTQTAKRPLTRADLTPREKLHLRACIHEAGHAVVGAMLGGEIHSAIVTNTRLSGVKGFVKYDHLPNHIDARVTYAGMAAEGRWLYGPRPTTRQLRYLQSYNGSDTDALCASAVREMHTPGTPAAEARLVVPPLLNRAWGSVVKVAQQLHRSGEASHDDVCAALGLPKGDRGGPGSTHVAFLTAGLRR